MIGSKRGNVVLVGFMFPDESGWKEAGLLFPSVVTGILRTVKTTMIHRKLGSLTKADMGAVDRELRRVLERPRSS